MSLYYVIINRWRSNVERLPVLLDDILQPVVVGILANQLPEPVACSGKLGPRLGVLVPAMQDDAAVH